MNRLKTGSLLALVAWSATFALPAMAQNSVPTDESARIAEQQNEIQTLQRGLQNLKSRYAAEVRKLRTLETRLQTLTAKVLAKQGVQRVADMQNASQAKTQAALAAARGTQSAAGTRAVIGSEVASQRGTEPSRSVEDVLIQQHTVFDQPLILEAGLTYTRYDRKQLTLNGFLALDAIFLGSIAVENVESDTFSYNFAARKALSPNLSISVNVPFIQRWTTYQKGGAGGSAASVAQADIGGKVGIGDVSMNMSYRIFRETITRPEIVITGGFAAPTGQAPYGITWTVLQRDQQNFIQFAVPTKQPTGQGIWSANLGASFLKTLDPAILFANVSVTHTFRKHFADLDTSADTMTPGTVYLGNAFNYGVGIAFALNEKTSLSMAFSQRLNGNAKIRADNATFSETIIGSDGNAATLNIGMTYALSDKMTFVSSLGIGLSPDAPDFMLTAKVPFTL